MDRFLLSFVLLGWFGWIGVACVRTMYVFLKVGVRLWESRNGLCVRVLCWNVRNVFVGRNFCLQRPVAFTFFERRRVRAFVPSFRAKLSTRGGGDDVKPS